MRPRKSGRQGWPPNLYRDRKQGVTYCRDRNPVTGHSTSLGKNQDEAIQATRLLNARVDEARAAAKAEETAQRALGPQDTTLSAYLDRFTNEILPSRRSRKGKPLSASTLKEYGRMLDVIRAELGAYSIQKLERRNVAKFLNAKPATASNRYRALLSLIFKHAVAEGLRDDSPVAATLPQTEVVERERLTLELFLAIKKTAPDWFRNALDLAIQTLQRREDLVEMRFEDIRDGFLIAFKINILAFSYADFIVLLDRGRRGKGLPAVHSQDQPAFPGLCLSVPGRLGSNVGAFPVP
jgi:hypothetical protein